MQLNSEMHLCLIYCLEKTKTNQAVFAPQKMFGMKCKTKTILASVDEYILGWPWSDREIKQFKYLAHSRHKRGQARLEHEVSSQEILLCQQRAACVKRTKAFNSLHIDQTAVIVNHVWIQHANAVQKIITVTFTDASVKGNDTLPITA